MPASFNAPRLWTLIAVAALAVGVASSLLGAAQAEQPAPRAWSQSSAI